MSRQGGLRKTFSSPMEAHAPFNIAISEIYKFLRICFPTDCTSPRLDDEKAEAIGEFIRNVCSREGTAGFFRLCSQAMRNLRLVQSGKVYWHTIGTHRDDGSDTLLPIKRMPMGLVEHCATVSQVIRISVLLITSNFCAQCSLFLERSLCDYFVGQCGLWFPRHKYTYLVQALLHLHLPLSRYCA